MCDAIPSTASLDLLPVVPCRTVYLPTHPSLCIYASVAVLISVPIFSFLSCLLSLGSYLSCDFFTHDFYSSLLYRVHQRSFVLLNHMCFLYFRFLYAIMFLVYLHYFPFVRMPLIILIFFIFFLLFLPSSSFSSEATYPLIHSHSFPTVSFASAIRYVTGNMRGRGAPVKLQENRGRLEHSIGRKHFADFGVNVPAHDETQHRVPRLGMSKWEPADR